MAANVEQSEPGAHVYEVFWNEEDGVVAVMQKYADLGWCLRNIVSMVLTFYRYADAAAAEAHRNSPHLKEAMQRSGSDLEMQPQTKVMTKLAGFARQG